MKSKIQKISLCALILVTLSPVALAQSLANVGISKNVKVKLESDSKKIIDSGVLDTPVFKPIKKEDPKIKNVAETPLKTNKPKNTNTDSVLNSTTATDLQIKPKIQKVYENQTPFTSGAINNIPPVNVESKIEKAYENDSPVIINPATSTIEKPKIAVEENHFQDLSPAQAKFNSQKPLVSKPNINIDNLTSINSAHSINPSVKLDTSNNVGLGTNVDPDMINSATLKKTTDLKIQMLYQSKVDVLPSDSQELSLTLYYHDPLTGSFTAITNSKCSDFLNNSQDYFGSAVCVIPDVDLSNVKDPSLNLMLVIETPTDTVLDFRNFSIKAKATSLNEAISEKIEINEHSCITNPNQVSDFLNEIDDFNANENVTATECSTFTPRFVLSFSRSL